jgi:hypothetical protein
MHLSFLSYCPSSIKKLSIAPKVVNPITVGGFRMIEEESRDSFEKNAPLRGPKGKGKRRR